MAKFNETSKEKTVKNLGGGEGYVRDSFKQELASIILNSMVKDQCYIGEDEFIRNVADYVKKGSNEDEFIAKAMVYTRTEGKMRSISHILAVELMSISSGKPFLKKALYEVMLRPDDATEILALWNLKTAGAPIPNAFRKAVKRALEKRWDAYQLKKYYGQKHKVKVSDLIKIAHPKPKNYEQAVMFKQAIEGTLPNIDTAQTVNATKTGEDRLATYIQMIKEGKLGYMALLKNLKNILVEAGDDSDSHMKNALDLMGFETDDVLKETAKVLKKALENEKAIKNSMILPFRIVQAAKAVDNLDIDPFVVNDILESLSVAFKISSGNVGLVKPGERVAIMLDDSGSMVSSRGGPSPFFIGATLTVAMAQNLDPKNTIGYLWSNDAVKVDLNVDPIKFVLNTRPKGWSTRLGKAILHLNDNKVKVDKIVIFTDMQQNGAEGYAFAIKRYKEQTNKDVKVLFWNLASYGGPTPIKLGRDGHFEIAGWSEKLLEIIPHMWEDPNYLVKEIEKVEL